MVFRTTQVLAQGLREPDKFSAALTAAGQSLARQVAVSEAGTTPQSASCTSIVESSSSINSDSQSSCNPHEASEAVVAYVAS